jgi:uncharacterized protein (DUF58 family)
MVAPDACKWHAAVQAAAGLSYALLHAGHRVGLLVFGARVLAQCPRGRGQHHYAAIASLLAATQPHAAGERSELGACVGQLHGAASVFVISDFLADDEMRRDLAATLQRCTALHVLQLSDVSETRLTPAEDVDLQDAETGARLPWRADARTDDLAAAQRTAMSTRLRGFCLRHGAAFSDWDVAQPWQQALMRHLLRARSNC